MPKITFIQSSGSSETVEARAGQSVMEAATNAMVRGIVGECGGSCSCATCHVYVNEPWFSKLRPADEMESGMLEGALDTNTQSRLCCQIPVTEALDGLVVRIPAAQF